MQRTSSLLRRVREQVRGRRRRPPSADPKRVRSHWLMRREYQPRNAHTATVLPGPTSPRRVNPSGDAHLAAAFPPGTGVTGPGQHQRLDPSLRALEPGGQAPVASRRAQIATLSRIVARARQQRRPVLRAHAAGLSVPQDPTRRRAARGAPGACIPARKDDERGEQVARVHGLNLLRFVVTGTP